MNNLFLSILRSALPVCLLLTSLSLGAQRQYSDTTYAPPAFEATYDPTAGPRVVLDGAHNNFHTVDGRYAPFAKVLGLDGFHVLGSTEPFSAASLSKMDVLVIANAVAEKSTNSWVAPTPSAFRTEEIEAVEKWVREGGRLFLLADHMPMAGAARELAAAFDFIFYDSFAADTSTASGTAIFTQADGGLSAHPLTVGGGNYFPVDSVASFTGQAFQLPEGAVSLLNCGEHWMNYLPRVAWQFPEGTPSFPVAGWSQLAVLEYGKGKMVVSGEAAMYSAQIAEMEDRSFKAGMNQDKGKNNYKLLLNLMRWLSE